MRYLPLFFDLQQQSCLLLGAGEVATRKLALLREAGARVEIVARELSPEIQAQLDDGTVIHRAETFAEAQLDGKVLVICATDDAALNARVADAAKARQIPVNVVDDPAQCSVIVPAIIDRDPVTVAVSSAGTSPVLARWIRSRIESLLPPSLGALARFMGSKRPAVKAALAEVGARRRFWERFLDSAIPNQLAAGQVTQAEAAFTAQLAGTPSHQGRVVLIGAGPGSPDLLTFRALQRLQEADVIVHDRLVPEAIVALARRDAERIYVGKCRDAHSVPQAEIGALLVRLAQEGKIVARLKGGDPFIFGRGGEEAQVLANAQIPFEIVPGITAAAGCAAFAGIPLTHRDHAQSVRFITGHTQNGQLDLDWAHLAHGRETLVFYMGLGATRTICQSLIAHGLPAHTPAALVEHGTTARQSVRLGTLRTLPDLIDGAASPSLLIIGEVAALHAQLAWFEGNPDAAPAFRAESEQRRACGLAEAA
ncbi:siroheme synthase CysG [Halothiobacillus sp. DCM-1]|uniref:siroheme synthase CysG n=1 Tax=Halothiobacillus sp. DCM-1 TaxID=3112558 RepID=UPI0032493AB3